MSLLDLPKPSVLPGKTTTVRHDNDGNRLKDTGDKPISKWMKLKLENPEEYARRNAMRAESYRRTKEQTRAKAKAAYDKRFSKVPEE